MIFQRDEIEKLILNEIYSVLGVDVDDIDNYAPELLVSELDFKRGLLKYWSTRPQINTISIDCILKPVRVVDIQIHRPSPDPDWFFIGMAGEGRIFNMTSNLMDARLLGIFRNYFYVDPLQQSYVATALNNNLGKPEYFIDYLNQIITLVTGGDAILSLKLGWGSYDLAKLPYKHIEGVARLIAEPYYERVLAFRSQVELDIDFKFSPELLKNKLEISRQLSKDFLKAIKPKNITKG